ncbi:Hypothetical_protein [Hexamita inflata]|uniref:Hypothetical_protein n=1 Tax=Hexamita inflata TaxID=28002 RepID=A0ABP1GH36_9EUKA
MNKHKEIINIYKYIIDLQFKTDPQNKRSSISNLLTVNTISIFLSFLTDNYQFDKKDVRDIYERKISVSIRHYIVYTSIQLILLAIQDGDMNIFLKITRRFGFFLYDRIITSKLGRNFSVLEETLVFVCIDFALYSLCVQRLNIKRSLKVFINKLTKGWLYRYFLFVLDLAVIQGNLIKWTYLIMRRISLYFNVLKALKQLF